MNVGPALAGKAVSRLKPVPQKKSVPCKLRPMTRQIEAGIFSYSSCNLSAESPPKEDSMRLIALVVPLLVLVGCSSTSADRDKVKPVPADRLLAYQAPVDNAGEIVVNRDVGMIGGGCYVAISIDHTVAARIGIGEEAHFKVPAGTRI